MDAKEQLKDDVRAGRVSVDRLVDLIFTLQQRIAELEKKLAAASSPTTKVAEPYSMKAEEKRQQARHPKKLKPKKHRKRGRIATQEKIARAERTENVFPEGMSENDCKLSHTRPVWRLEQGRAVLM